MVLLHPQVKSPWQGKTCHSLLLLSSTQLGWQISVPIGWSSSMSCLPKSSNICSTSPTLFPAIQQNGLCMGVVWFCFYPLSPDHDLTWMTLFSDCLKVDTSETVGLIWIPDISPSFSFLSPFFTRDPLLGCLMLSLCGWAGADKCGYCFSSAILHQASGSKWNGINTCQVLSYSLMGLWAAAGINLCVGDISTATLKSSNGFTTLPRPLEMKSCALGLMN